MLEGLGRRCLGVVLAFVLAACGDDKPKDGAGPSASSTAESAASTAPPSTSPAGSTPLADIALPADVVAVASIGDPAKLFDRITAVANAVQPGTPKLGDLAAEALAERYALQPTAIDRTKPIQVAVFDPKMNLVDPFIFIARVGSKEKLLAAVKGSPGPDPGDGLVTWGSVFARVEGDVAMISRDKTQLVAHGAFFTKLAAAAPVEGVTCVVPMQHIGAHYGKDIEALGMQMKSFAPPEQAAQNEAMLGALTASLKELKTLSISLKPTEDGLFLDIAAEPTALSTWRAAFGFLGSKSDTKLAAKLPATSFLAGVAMMPREARPLVKKYFEWVSTMPGASGMGGALAVYDQAWDSFSGDVAFAAFSMEGKPAILALSGVTDAAKVREAQRAAAEAMIKAPLSPELKQLKVKWTFKKAAYKIGDVEVDVTKTEMGNAPPGVGAMLAWMGESHSAVGASESVIAYGPGAKGVLEAYLGGKLPGGFDASPMYGRAKRASVKDSIFKMTASANDIVQLAGLPVATKGAAPLTLSAGASDGVLHFGIDLPTDQIPAIAVGLGALQSAAMEAMQGGGGAAPPQAPKPRPKAVP